MNIGYETHLSGNTQVFNVNSSLNDIRDAMSDSDELGNLTRKNEVINLSEEFKKTDSCCNCCKKDVPILLLDKNIITTKTIRRTKRIITTKFIAKSKSMDSETLKDCIGKGNFENIETENPEIMMEMETSEITTLSKPDPDDENKIITHIVYDSNENSRSLLSDCDLSSNLAIHLVQQKKPEEKIITITSSDNEIETSEMNECVQNDNTTISLNDDSANLSEIKINTICLNDDKMDLQSPMPSHVEFKTSFDVNDTTLQQTQSQQCEDEENSKTSNIVQNEASNIPDNIPKSISGTTLKSMQSSPSIAAQFNIIAKSRKTTVPRCRRADPPNKSTTRYMTQPVISDKPGSAECLRDEAYANLTDSGFTNSVQDITMIASEDKSNISSDSSLVESHNLSKYSRSLSGTTRISKESIDGIENTSYRNKNLKRENISEIDNKSENIYGSEELTGSPENNIESVFYDESKSPSTKPMRRSERHLSGGSSNFNNTKVFQSSLPGTLRRPTPQHIRIHSDEIKAPSTAISDLTSEYLSRKISQPDRKDTDNTFSVGPLSSRYSPFRHGVDTGGLENAVLKSPSAQALMRNSINRSRSSNSNTSNNKNQRSINSSERTIERSKYDEDKDLSFNLRNSTEICEENISVLGDSVPNIPDEIIIEEVDDRASLEKQKLEKRYLIIQELLSVESEYVKVLEILVNHFMIPLKLEKLLDETQVDTIFNKIHELLAYHAGFLSILQVWEPKDSIGDKVSQMFSRTTVQDCYISFIENFSLSEKMLENALNSKSSLQKFVELKQKESKNKLPLKALLVQPVQRIPRYELLLKRLIEYTSTDSIDYSYLLEAQTAIHQLAIKINAVKEAKQDESFIEGLKLLDRLLSPMTINQNRQFIRHDAVTVEDRKEAYCLFLFSDQLIVTTMKRRGTQTAKKPTVLRLMTPTGLDFVDNIKYKFISRINIENIEFEQNEDTDQKILLRNREMKDRKDLSLLQEIETLVSKLDRKHQDIDNCVKRLYANVLQDMEESRNSRVAPTVNNSIASQFLVTTKEGIERMEFTFNSIEKKQSWEKAVKDLKTKLVDVPRTPRFNQALSITRTQSGMQFCCACPIEGYNNFGIRDVWICQSDGFTGHLCLLSMQTDPIVTMNSPLPGCNSKVICITAVPGYLGSTRRSSLSMDGRYSRPIERLKRQTGDIYQLDTQVEIQEDDPDADQDTTLNIDDSNTSQSCSDSGDSDLDESNKLIRKISTEESPKNKKLSDPFKATMWIGLEDGTILVFYSADNVRMTKSKKKIDLGSAVISMLHFDNRVYVSLLNGELVTFKRHIEGYWDLDYSVITKLTSQTSPIKNLLAVTGFIWGTSQRNIVIINPTSVKIENTFTLSESNDQRPISHLACSGQCVWITQENSTKILLYHATSYEYLCEVNIRPSVIQRLQVWDDIIIRHKEACLRITCLLVCKDVLWAGTSAGVILTIPIPNVATSTTKSNVIQPKVESLDRGHTGNVRFLVSLESSIRSSHQSSRRQSLSPCTTMATQMKIICGGDGYEDFSSKLSRESNQDIGKDDAINHIQIWDIL